MTDDDKALVKRLTAAIKESIGKQFNATPIHPDPSVGDWAASGGVIDLKQVAQSLLPIISDRIEALSAENERLREKLIGIRAEIDDMENPFNEDGNPEMRQGFEVAVDQAFNIVTAALEGEPEDLGPEFEAVWDANRDKLYEDDTK